MIKKFIYKKILAEINKANNILLTLHPGPDADSVGSNLALYHFLTKMSKKVTVLGGDSKFPQNLSAIPGSENILAKNIFQIDLNNFDLFIINDISSPKQISKQGDVILPKNLKTIIIDHHPTNTKFADINLIEETSPATCQIIYNFFESEKIKITKNIAACLYAGIYRDSGGFKYLNTTYKTLLTAANLAKIYPDFNNMIFEIENNDSSDRLKFLSLMLGSIDTFVDGKVAVSSISHDTLQKNNINSDVINSSDVANYLKSVIGWEIGVCMIEQQPNIIKLSFRTRDTNKFDLTKISVALGGGGHKAAAGVTLTDSSISKAKELIIAKICQVYPNINII